MRTTLVIIAGLAALSIGEARAQSTPFLSQVQTYAFKFCPGGTAPLGAQLMPISQNQALFSLLGTTYGGDGQSTFALPLGRPIYTADRYIIRPGETEQTALTLTQCIVTFGMFPSRD